MRNFFVSMMIVTLAIVGMAASQDFVKGVEKGGVANLSGMNPDVFDGIMFQGEGWFMDPSMTITPSQAAVLKNDAGEGAGLGGEPLLLGSLAKNVRQTQVFFTPIELSAFQARYGNVSPELILRN